VLEIDTERRIADLLRHRLLLPIQQLSLNGHHKHKHHRLINEYTSTRYIPLTDGLGDEDEVKEEIQKICGFLKQIAGQFKEMSEEVRV